jgi:Txe/YoeB family toxin of Txe-Axe toxin-antitoxin module
MSLCGYAFPTDPQGTRQLASLFRSSVLHLGAHTLTSNYEDYDAWRKRKDPRLAQFTAALLEDVKSNTYMTMHHPDTLVDMAFATTLALRRLKPVDKIMNPATRILVSLLVKANTGLLVDGLKKERDLAVHLGDILDQYKEKAKLSLTNEKISLREDKLKVADEIYNSTINAGTITETPFFPHTEQLGACSVFPSSYLVDSDITRETDFRRHLSFLGGTLPPSEGIQEASKRMAENEAAQVYDAWRRQKERDAKMLSKYVSLLGSTRFKSVGLPQQDYTEYLRVRSRCKSEAHRLIESLLVARDALDEDPKKLYGVLDLQEVIQVVASKSPSVDVFMLDENLSKSYSWIILFDASKSMSCAKELALELFMMLTEVANELLLDPYSWGAYAFNDRLFVIKDLKERYNTLARSRIGGIRFEGSTYLPDALTLAGNIVKTRNENMRLVTVISDGWPFGYMDVNVALKETLNTLTGGNISVIGIGAQSRQMESYFRSCSTVYSLRDLTKNFSNLYFEASSAAAEA